MGKRKVPGVDEGLGRDWADGVDEVAWEDVEDEDGTRVVEGVVVNVEEDLEDIVGMGMGSTMDGATDIVLCKGSCIIDKGSLRQNQLAGRGLGGFLPRLPTLKSFTRRSSTGGPAFDCLIFPFSAKTFFILLLTWSHELNLHQSVRSVKITAMPTKPKLRPSFRRRSSIGSELMQILFPTTS